MPFMEEPGARRNTGPTETSRTEESESTMNAKTSYPTTTNRGLRRALALLVALLLASLAFGVGLPWMVVDAPPSSETQWAREVQSKAPSTDPLTPSAAQKRPSGLFVIR